MLLIWREPPQSPHRESFGKFSMNKLQVRAHGHNQCRFERHHNSFLPLRYAETKQSPMDCLHFPQSCPGQGCKDTCATVDLPWGASDFSHDVFWSARAVPSPGRGHTCWHLQLMSHQPTHWPSPCTCLSTSGMGQSKFCAPA